jgi:hypothetical protein
MVQILIFQGTNRLFSPFRDIARSALLCRADRYLSMDSFCGAIGETDACKTCPYLGAHCKYDDLRLAIEDLLPAFETSRIRT